MGKTTIRELKEKFTHVNPQYIKNERMGIPNDNEPEIYESYESKKKRIFFETGCLRTIKRILKHNGYKIKIKDNTVSEPHQDYSCNKIKLRKEQKPAVKACLKKKRGIVRGPCSSGKSVIGLDFIARTNETGMIIVWNKDHQKHWILEAKRNDLLNLSPSDIGGVGGVFSKRKFGKLNVCMQQSLWNKDHRDFFGPRCGAVVADEVQRFAARTCNEVITDLPAKYKIGLSANERRKDGKEFLIYDAFGQLLHAIPDSGIGSRKKSRINLVPTKYEDDEYDLNKNYVALMNNMARDVKRNRIIIKRTLQKTKKKKLVLILVERKYQALYLWEHLKNENLKVRLLVGKTSKAEIREADDWEQSWKRKMSKYDDDKAFFQVKKLGTAKKIDVIVATQKGDVGLNIKTIDHVIVTTPTGGNLERFNQQRGRAERDYDEELIALFGKKKTPTVDYIWDLKIESLRKKGRKILNNFNNVHILQKRSNQNGKESKRKRKAA